MSSAQRSAVSTMGQDYRRARRESAREGGGAEGIFDTNDTNEGTNGHEGDVANVSNTCATNYHELHEGGLSRAGERFRANIREGYKRRPSGAETQHDRTQPPVKGRSTDRPPLATKAAFDWNTPFAANRARGGAPARDRQRADVNGPPSCFNQARC